MVIDVREKTIEEFEARLTGMSTEFNKINYLESAIKKGSFDFEVKRFLYGELAELYTEKKMYEKAARAMSNKAANGAMARDKMEDFLEAAELYVKLGKIEDAENMFMRALREAKAPEKSSVKLARKNIYLTGAQQLEASGKKASAVKFYEKLMKMKLEGVEREEIKMKLLERYKSLGMFREARMLEGI